MGCVYKIAFGGRGEQDWMTVTKYGGGWGYVTGGHVVSVAGLS